MERIPTNLADFEIGYSHLEGLKSFRFFFHYQITGLVVERVNQFRDKFEN